VGEGSQREGRRLGHLPPFWFDPGTPGYHQVVNAITAEPGTHVRFLAGYERLYPEAQGYPGDDTLFLELLGPPNDILSELVADGKFNMNHLSIISRLNFGKFRMVFAGDAQMENWSHFDRERMYEGGCTALKTAHHGSKNDTQGERLEHLSPRYVIVSSDPAAKDELPYLVGSSVFHTYTQKSNSPCVALTHACGSVRITVKPSGVVESVKAFGDAIEAAPDLSKGTPLQSSDWGPEALALNRAFPLLIRIPDQWGSLFRWGKEGRGAGDQAAG
jgi:hypothetical protein